MKKKIEKKNVVVKKKNPQDATLRNVNALKKKVKVINEQLQITASALNQFSITIQLMLWELKFLKQRMGR